MVPTGSAVIAMRRSAPMPSCAKTRPSAVPSAARTLPSARNCLTSRYRPAPSATRSESSWRRAMARDRRMPATFAQAMSSTNAAAPMRTSRRGRASPERAARIGTTRVSIPLNERGSSDCSARITRSTSACAVCIETPGLSRAKSRSKRTCALFGLERMPERSRGARNSACS